MKIHNRLIAVLFVMLLVNFSFAQELISNTSHNFSGQAWSGGEICIVCHTPHNSDTTVPEAPLWNHELTTFTGYTLYSSGSFDGAATIADPGSISKLCLSCHDGTVALENFGGTTTGTTFLAAGDIGFLDTDLSDDHPVSFVYNDALATLDGELHPPSTTAALGGFIETKMLFGTAGSATVECASCHNVHGGVVGTPLLRIDNAGSLLCLTCHNK